MNTAAPSFDKLTFISGLNLDTASVLGEKIIGSQSRAIAQLTERSSATEVEIVYLTESKFIPGEIPKKKLIFFDSHFVMNSLRLFFSFSG